MAQNALARRLIIAYARQYGVDPDVALRVARGEGGVGFGAVGDQGTSYGPYQLHRGGALPAGRGAAWANSPAGIAYAIRGIAKYAAGLHGAQGVAAAVRGFERPANPQAEIARDLGGSLRAAAMPMMSAAGGQQAAGPAVGNPRAALAQALISANQQTAQHQQPDYTNVFQSLAATRQGPTTAPPPLAGSGKTQKGSLAELFYDPLGAIKNGQQIAPIGGHSDHVHIADMNPNAMLAAIDQARRMGLRVSENPYVGQVHRVHVADSNHYKVIGQANGRKIGAAADVSGSPQSMAAYYRWAATHL